MTKLIYIHGINNESNSKVSIEESWTAALKEGLHKQGLHLPDDTTIIAAFYGDILHQETDKWDTELQGASPMSISSPDTDYITRGEATLYLELQRDWKISDEEVQTFLDNEDEMPTAAIMAKGIHKKWLKAIACALEQIIPSQASRLTKIFLKQASAYLEKPGLKTKIDRKVFNQVFSNISPEDDIIIISHSLGTIVAYDLIRQSMSQLKPKLFLTAGSPLGIKIVKKKLGLPLICLPNAPHWVNVADKEDFVAFTNELNATTFGCDKTINYSHVDNGNEDAHDILMYLQDQLTSKTIYDAL